MEALYSVMPNRVPAQLMSCPVASALNDLDRSRDRCVMRLYPTRLRHRGNTAQTGIEPVLRNLDPKLTTRCNTARGDVQLEDNIRKSAFWTRPGAAARTSQACGRMRRFGESERPSASS